MTEKEPGQRLGAICLVGGGEEDVVEGARSDHEVGRDQC